MKMPIPFSAKEIAETTYKRLKAEGKLKSWYSEHKDSKTLKPESNMLDEAALILINRLKSEFLTETA
jgi:hypothetical protein